MKFVCLIFVAFSAINIAAGKPFGKEVYMSNEYKLCEEFLNKMVNNICDIYRTHPEYKTYKVDETVHEPSMTINENDKSDFVYTLCCYGRCVKQTNIMPICLEQDKYHVIQPIPLEEYLDKSL